MKLKKESFYKIHFKNSNKECLISEDDTLFIEKAFCKDVKSISLYEDERITEIINLTEILFIEQC